MAGSETSFWISEAGNHSRQRKPAMLQLAAATGSVIPRGKPGPLQWLTSARAACLLGIARETTQRPPPTFHIPNLAQVPLMSGI